MRCLACDKNLSDKEANRKYFNWKKIANPEERYIGLCNGCIDDTGLTVVDNPHDSDEVIVDNEAEVNLE